MSKDDVFEIEGGLGELDYGGIALKTMDFMVETIVKSIVAPEWQDRINTITGETERSIKEKREGFFDPRRSSAFSSGVGPTWSVYSDPKIIEHMQVLEYADNGRNATARPTARSRRVKTGIRNILQLRFNKEMRVQVRNAKKKVTKK